MRTSNLAAPTTPRCLTVDVLLPPSGQRPQHRAQPVRTRTRNFVLDLRMRFFPDWKGLVEQGAACRRDGQEPIAAVLLVDRNLYQSAAFQRLERSSERGAIHGEQIGDAAEIGWHRPVERYQQRELPIGQVKWPQYLVEAPRQRARGPLGVQAQASVAHERGHFEWQGGRI
jgi:hypothetical protein